MAELGKYCKAFLLSDLRAWAGWEESASAESAIAKAPMSQGEEAVVFIHHDYRVTGTVFLDEQVIYTEVTPEWIAFCQDELGFEVPAWVNEKNV